MKSKHVSQDSVNAACNSIAAEGGSPTFDALVKRLGGGSNSTVKPYLDAWIKASRIPPRPIPDAVQNHAAMLAQSIWTMACDAAFPEVERVKADAAATLEASRDMLTSCMKISATMEEERDNHAIKIEDLQIERAELRSQLRSVEPVRVALIEAAELAERRRDECEATRRELAHVQGQYAALLAQQTDLLERVSTPRRGGSKSRAPDGISPGTK